MNPDQKPVNLADAKNLLQEKVSEQVLEQTVKEFATSLKMISRYKYEMSKREFSRAVIHGLNAGLFKLPFKLRSTQEQRLANIVNSLMEQKTVLLAYKLQEENENGTKEQTTTTEETKE